MESAVTQPIVAPGALLSELPISAHGVDVVRRNRTEIRNILSGKDNRLLLIVGPCSIHDVQAAFEYAQRLSRLHVSTRDKLHIVMRLYFEKPRTALGWKGLIMDPHLNGSFDIEQGLRAARSLLVRIASLELGAAMEMLDPIIMEYVSDLISWASVGARTSESQIHRQSASNSRIPVGFKNSTDGSLDSAICAIKTAASSHCYPGIDREGRVCLVRTQGNASGHLILRGGRNGPNCTRAGSLGARQALIDARLPTACIVDCSHMNSGKEYRKQIPIWKEAVLRRRDEGESHIRGVMAESFLHDGNQSIVTGQDLRYGVSVTDPCIGWEATEELIRWTYGNV